MAQQEICQNCNQKHDCQEIYRQLGDTKCPSVVTKAVVAFLAPLMVFIAVLAVFEKILAQAINPEELRTVLSLLLALLAASVCILIIKAVSKQLSKKHIISGQYEN